MQYTNKPELSKDFLIDETGKLVNLSAFKFPRLKSIWQDNIPTKRRRSFRKRNN